MREGSREGQGGGRQCEQEDVCRNCKGARCDRTRKGDVRKETKAGERS